ncbi:DivIVA domain-containing protein [Georgenia faecalis]|uniref:DivIVA domain-containing protein n=1 Tax=Georgenia faecalis TaxID=2483799 RepID=A0ABV9DDK2_9MICO|nr:DivIVA domain-containing protein [Georgenia faecalis]
MVMFPAAGRMGTGYDRAQVEEFFARARAAYEATQREDAGGDRGDSPTLDENDVRAVAFDLVRDGYEATAVDAALDRLEAALVHRRREDFIAAHGQQAWMDRIADRATTLYPRLVRPRGQRFSPPQGRRGYDAAAVDELLDRLVAYFDAGAELSAAELRTATFPEVGRRRAYAEGTVDAYLDRAVEVLLAVE